MLCNFTIQDNGLFKCSNCGYLTKLGKAKRNCKPLTGPTVVQKLANFSQAAVQHELNGRPECTQSQILDRLKICESCELFKLAPNGIGGICTHNSCGCNITDTAEYFNKLAWADQKCPLDKWLAIEPDNVKIENSGV